MLVSNATEAKECRGGGQVAQPCVTSKQERRGEWVDSISLDNLYDAMKQFTSRDTSAGE